jgi:hypothetical protein
MALFDDGEEMAEAFDEVEVHHDTKSVSNGSVNRIGRVPPLGAGSIQHARKRKSP